MSFWAGIMPPMPILGRSLLSANSLSVGTSNPEALAVELEIAGTGAAAAILCDARPVVERLLEGIMLRAIDRIT